jgi:hypothetical protein
VSQLQIVLGVVLGLFLLAGLVGGLWAAFRSADQETRIKRLQSERDDLLSRLNFIEPKLKALEEQNKVLLDLHNPADQISALKAQEAANHKATFELLTAQHKTLQAIDRHLLGAER